MVTVVLIVLGALVIGQAVRLAINGDRAPVAFLAGVALVLAAMVYLGDRLNGEMVGFLALLAGTAVIFVQAVRTTMDSRIRPAWPWWPLLAILVTADLGVWVVAVSSG